MNPSNTPASPFMHAIDRYGLEPHPGPYESWPTTSFLRVDDRPTATRIPGYVIEAQYASRLGDLLITSFDCLFEESNAFVLLNPAHLPIAETQLLAPYASFLLHEHWVVDDCTVGLHYYERLFYTLTISPPRWFGSKPRLRLRRCHRWQSDARMRAADERLQARLAATRKSLD